MNSIIRSMSATRPSRLLVLLNPKGGSGRALKIWSQTSQPILRLAGEQAKLVCGHWRARGHLNAYGCQIYSLPVLRPTSSTSEIVAACQILSCLLGIACCVIGKEWQCICCWRLEGGAGVECVTQVTSYAEHGREIVASMSLQDLESIDGILAVNPRAVTEL